jgi:hypothetical protein
MKTSLSHMFATRFAQRLWVRKNLLILSLTLFENMLVEKKIIPLCPMFLKLHFIMLNKDCQHAKNESLYVELEVGIMCWINICKVWHMKITWRISFNLSKISPYSKKEKPNLNMKTQRVCWNSIKWFSTKTLM